MPRKAPVSDARRFEVLQDWPVILAEIDRDPERLYEASVVLPAGDSRTLRDPDTISSGLAGGKLREIVSSLPAVEITAEDLQQPAAAVTGDLLENEPGLPPPLAKTAEKPPVKTMLRKVKKRAPARGRKRTRK